MTIRFYKDKSGHVYFTIDEVRQDRLIWEMDEGVMRKYQEFYQYEWERKELPSVGEVATELCKELQAPRCKECGHKLQYIWAEHFWVCPNCDIY